MVSQSRTRHWIFSSSSSGAKGIVCKDIPSKKGGKNTNYFDYSQVVVWTRTIVTKANRGHLHDTVDKGFFHSDPLELDESSDRID
jgi:hypothetical protein